MIFKIKGNNVKRLIVDYNHIEDGRIYGVEYTRTHPRGMVLDGEEYTVGNCAWSDDKLYNHFLNKMKCIAN